MENNNTKRELTKEQMTEIIENEGLDEYVKVKFNEDEGLGEYCVMITEFKGFYNVSALGERGIHALNVSFDKIEEAYYCAVKYMRWVKSQLKEYKPFKKR